MDTPGSKTSMRRARAEDAEALSDLAFRSKAHWGYDPAFLAACRAELEIRADQIEWFPTYLLDDAGAIAGFYSLESLSTDCIELNHLFLEPARIGRGEGRILLTHAAARARERGYRVMRIQSDPHAEAFYTACGATRVGEEASASIPGRTLPVLELALAEGAR